jgi:hypothetical protein
MGDRGNIIMNMEDGNKIYLYTHWGGHGLKDTLKSALERGRDRWNDEQYLSRIIFNEMTKGREMDLTGYGISTYECDNENERLFVDVKNQTVTVEGKPSVSFNDFVASKL